jgi:hypothetical protein
VVIGCCGGDCLKTRIFCVFGVNGRRKGVLFLFFWIFASFWTVWGVFCVLFVRAGLVFESGNIPVLKYLFI